MAFKLAELFVQIGANTGSLNAALAGVHSKLLGMGAVGTGLSGVMHGVTQAVAGIGTASGPIGMGIVAAIALAGAITKVAMEAGHLAEAVAKTEQTFGSLSGKVIAEADEMARKFGLVKSTFLSTASSFGLMLEGAGIGRQQATDMSIALVKLAGDAQAFFDVPFDEALMRLQSGLSGEMEAVRKWGINLSEANVHQKAMALGLAQGNGELDQATKTVARYAIILDSTKAAQGAMQRESGGLVAQWEKLWGTVQNLGATIGGAFATGLTNLLKVANLLLGAITPVIELFVWLESSWESMWGKIGNVATRMAGFGDFFSTGAVDPNKAANQAATDQRLDQSLADFQKDQVMAAAGKGAHQAKGWSGGLEEYAKHLQEGAWGGGKDDEPKKQTDLQAKMVEALQKIQVQLSKPQPGVVT